MTGMRCCWRNGMLYKHIGSPTCTHLYWANGSEKVFQLNISRGWREAFNGHSAAFALSTSLALPDRRRATSTHLTTPFSATPARQDDLNQWQMRKHCPNYVKKNARREVRKDTEIKVSTSPCLHGYVSMHHSTVERSYIVSLPKAEF